MNANHPIFRLSKTLRLAIALLVATLAGGLPLQSALAVDVSQVVRSLDKKRVEEKLWGARNLKGLPRDALDAYADTRVTSGVRPFENVVSDALGFEDSRIPHALLQSLNALSPRKGRGYRTPPWLDRSELIQAAICKNLGHPEESVRAEAAEYIGVRLYSGKRQTGEPVRLALLDALAHCPARAPQRLVIAKTLCESFLDQPRVRETLEAELADTAKHPNPAYAEELRKGLSEGAQRLRKEGTEDHGLYDDLLHRLESPLTLNDALKEMAKIPPMRLASVISQWSEQGDKWTRVERVLADTLSGGDEIPVYLALRAIAQMSTKRGSGYSVLPQLSASSAIQISLFKVVDGTDIDNRRDAVDIFNNILGTEHLTADRGMLELLLEVGQRPGEKMIREEQTPKGMALILLARGAFIDRRRDELLAREAPHLIVPATLAIPRAESKSSKGPRPLRLPPRAEAGQNDELIDRIFEAESRTSALSSLVSLGAFSLKALVEAWAEADAPVRWQRLENELISILEAEVSNDKKLALAFVLNLNPKRRGYQVSPLLEGSPRLRAAIRENIGDGGTDVSEAARIISQDVLKEKARETKTSQARRRPPQEKPAGTKREPAAPTAAPPVSELAQALEGLSREELAGWHSSNNNSSGTFIELVSTDLTTQDADTVLSILGSVERFLPRAIGRNSWSIPEWAKSETFQAALAACLKSDNAEVRERAAQILVERLASHRASGEALEQHLTDVTTQPKDDNVARAAFRILSQTVSNNALVDRALNHRLVGAKTLAEQGELAEWLAERRPSQAKGLEKVAAVLKTASGPSELDASLARGLREGTPNSRKLFLEGISTLTPKNGGGISLRPTWFGQATPELQRALVETMAESAEFAAISSELWNKIPPAEYDDSPEMAKAVFMVLTRSPDVGASSLFHHITTWMELFPDALSQAPTPMTYFQLVSTYVSLFPSPANLKLRGLVLQQLEMLADYADTATEFPAYGTETRKNFILTFSKGIADQDPLAREHSARALAWILDERWGPKPLLADDDAAKLEARVRVCIDKPGELSNTRELAGTILEKRLGLTQEKKEAATADFSLPSARFLSALITPETAETVSLELTVPHSAAQWNPLKSEPGFGTTLARVFEEGSMTVAANTAVGLLAALESSEDGLALDPREANPLQQALVAWSLNPHSHAGKAVEFLSRWRPYDPLSPAQQGALAEQFRRALRIQPQFNESGRGAELRVQRGLKVINRLSKAARPAPWLTDTPLQLSVTAAVFAESADVRRLASRALGRINGIDGEAGLYRREAIAQAFLSTLQGGTSAEKWRALQGIRLMIRDGVAPAWLQESELIQKEIVSYLGKEHNEEYREVLGILRREGSGLFVRELVAIIRRELASGQVTEVGRTALAMLFLTKRSEEIDLQLVDWAANANDLAVRRQSAFILGEELRRGRMHSDRVLVKLSEIAARPADAEVQRLALSAVLRTMKPLRERALQGDRGPNLEIKNNLTVIVDAKSSLSKLVKQAVRELNHKIPTNDVGGSARVFSKQGDTRRLETECRREIIRARHRM